MKKILVLFFLIITQTAKTQTTQEHPHCNNPDFDRTVKSYLHFTVPTISVEALHSHPNDFLKLDAREMEEYQISHIPGAKYIGYKNVDFKKIEKLDKKTKIVVYCSIGYRSEKIGEKLKKQGFSNVYNLFGSIFEWANMGYALEKANNQSTNEIHGFNKSWSKWVTNPNIIKKY